MGFLPPMAVAVVSVPDEVVAVGVSPATATAVTVVPAVAEVSSVGVVAEAPAAPVADDEACITPPSFETLAVALVPAPAAVADPPSDCDVCAPLLLVEVLDPPVVPLVLLGDELEPWPRA
ncbi:MULTISPECIES: hypothetical protein [Kaistia]|uniref:Uncharacterized protein n=1 Tax=Kaistia nematophila TaxID=2994654 RepID=A0A9X3E099_9HYPH|nr:hypothetical protein [Kaistia nematophila]MCX5569244.1 hypothetical protein [Kaistia nematophila]